MNSRRSSASPAPPHLTSFSPTPPSSSTAVEAPRRLLWIGGFRSREQYRSYLRAPPSDEMISRRCQLKGMAEQLLLGVTDDDHRMCDNVSYTINSRE